MSRPPAFDRADRTRGPGRAGDRRRSCILFFFALSRGSIAVGADAAAPRSVPGMRPSARASDRSAAGRDRFTPTTKRAAAPRRARADRSWIWPTRRRPAAAAAAAPGQTPPGNLCRLAAAAARQAAAEAAQLVSSRRWRCRPGGALRAAARRHAEMAERPAGRWPQDRRHPARVRATDRRSLARRRHRRQSGGASRRTRRLPATSCERMRAAAGRWTTLDGARRAASRLARRCGSVRLRADRRSLARAAPTAWASASRARLPASETVAAGSPRLDADGALLLR